MESSTIAKYYLLFNPTRPVSDNYPTREVNQPSLVLDIKTARLSIQYLDPTDAPFIVSLLNEPSFLQNIGDKGVRTTEDALSYIQTAGTDNYAEYGFGMFRVTLKATGEAIGMCGLLQRDFLAYPDIGFAFLGSCQGQGLGTEAAFAVKDWAATTKGIHRLAAFTSLTNKASIRVLEKIGFISIGEQDLPGKYGRCHVLEWKATPSE